MHWYPSATPADTISGIAFGPNNLLACVSWDGVARIEDLHHTVSYTTAFSRPLFAVAWQARGAQLWCGGGENRVSWLDVEREITADRFACEDPVLALRAANAADTVVAGSTISTTFLADPRTQHTQKIGAGAQCLDVRGHYLATALGDQNLVVDLRSPRTPLAVNKMLPGTRALALQWVSSDAYAVADRESRICVASLAKPSFTFRSNRVKHAGSAASRPIYALAQDSEPLLAAAGGDRQIHIWDCTRRVLKTKIAFPMACVAVAYSRDHQFMAAALSTDEWSTTPAAFRRPSRAKVMIHRLAEPAVAAA